jgi:hypothetical protein
MSRQLSGAGPSQGPGLPQAYLFLTTSVDTYTIADIILSKFDVLGKVTTKVDKGGHQFRPADPLAAQALFILWDPFLTNPFTHMLSYDCRPGPLGLTDCRAIANRVSLVIHSSFTDAVTYPIFRPMDRGARPPKPFKVTIKLISSSGRDTKVYRVIFCLSSYRDLHVALHSFVTIGSGDHEETQVPQI